MEDQKVTERLISPRFWECYYHLEKNEFDYHSYLAPLGDRSGKLLSEWIATDMTYVELVDYSRQILNVLGFLEDRGILHSQLKPSNICLDDFYENAVFLTVKLTGAPELPSEHETGRQPQRRCMSTGQTEYVAPEMVPALDGTSPKVVKRTPVWNFGSVVHDMVFGPNGCNLREECHRIKDTNSLMCLHYSGRPVLHDGITKDLVDFLPQCLLKDPEARPSIQELLSHPFLRNTTGVRETLHSPLRDAFLNHGREKWKLDSRAADSDPGSSGFSHGEVIYDCACQRVKMLGSEVSSPPFLDPQMLVREIAVFRASQPKPFDTLPDRHGQVFRITSYCPRTIPFLQPFSEHITQVKLSVSHGAFDFLNGELVLPKLNDLSISWLCDSPFPALNLDVFPVLNLLNLFWGGRLDSLPIIRKSLGMLFIASDFSSECFRLWKLPKLSYLNAWHCDITDLDGISDTTLPELDTLDMYWSSFASNHVFRLVHSNLERIEMKDCGTLYAANFNIDLPSLTNFSIEDEVIFETKTGNSNDLSAPSRLVSLPKAEYVHIMNCKFGTDKLVIDLTSFPELHRIYLGVATTQDSFSVSVVSPVLQQLWINGTTDHACPIRVCHSSAPELDDVLIEVFHDFVMEQDDFSDQCFPKLNQLKLYDCSFHSSAGFQLRSDCLTSLALDVCPDIRLGDDGKVLLPNLERLWLEKCDVVFIGAKGLQGMPKLNSFVLRQQKKVTLEENCFARVQLKWIWIEPAHELDDCPGSGAKSADYSWFENYLNGLPEVNSDSGDTKSKFAEWLGYEGREWKAQTPRTLRRALECTPE